MKNYNMGYSKKSFHVFIVHTLVRFGAIHHYMYCTGGGGGGAKVSSHMLALIAQSLSAQLKLLFLV